MKQTIFTTRQRAEEIIKEAVTIWEHSNNGEQLEGLDRDPVLALFMTALAYQANEIDNEIEQLRVDILNEFARMLIPYERIHALPATAVVEVSMEIACRHKFWITGQILVWRGALSHLFPCSRRPFLMAVSHPLSDWTPVDGKWVYSSKSRSVTCRVGHS